MNYNGSIHPAEGGKLMKNEKLRTEIFRTLKFVLFSASACIVQVLYFALLNELL